MSKPTKVALAISCFLPLYFILGAQNLFAVFCAYSNPDGVPFREVMNDQNGAFYFNTVMFVVWLVLCVIGFVGIRRFTKSFLKATKLTKETVVITKAENITADYYFTYFSLFVISFFGVDPTTLEDVLILAFLMVLIILVYISNDMFFVNPVLNIRGYKSFSITYYKSQTPNIEEGKTFEIKVFARENLNRMIGKKYFVTFSPHDFSVCYPVSKK